mgnify:FL=1
MNEILEIEFLDIDENEEYKKIIRKVIETCFEEEKLQNSKLYVNVILTNPKNIKEINTKFRNIEKETDVLSFPMFEKEDIEIFKNSENEIEEVLGDIIVSIERVKEQAIEYGHSFEREFAYMIVHGFYHLMGYDHMTEEDKSKMRPKEEKILEKLKITRE